MPKRKRMAKKKRIMILKKLIINGLFGHFNHVVEFKNDNITIITAPNGYGKTVCLRIIDSIFKRDFFFLSDLQFSSIELQTLDDSIIFEKNLETSPNKITLKHNESGEEYEYSTNLKALKILREQIDDRIPHLHRIGETEWEDLKTNEILSFDEVLNLYGDFFSNELGNRDLPKWYLDFSNSLKSHFIQDQRLILRREKANFRRKIKSFVDTIEKYADEFSQLKARI